MVCAVVVSVNARGICAFTGGGLEVLRRIIESDLGERRVRFGKRRVECDRFLKSELCAAQSCRARVASQSGKMALAFEHLGISLRPSLALRCRFLLCCGRCSELSLRRSWRGRGRLPVCLPFCLMKRNDNRGEDQERSKARDRRLHATIPFAGESSALPDSFSIARTRRCHADRCG